MRMETEHEARVRAVTNRLLERKQREERGEPVEAYTVGEALRDLYDLFEDDDEVDEFVRAVHEWRGHDPDCMDE
jgi:hypothetical protein